jgi:hypothetical protein
MGNGRWKMGVKTVDHSNEQTPIGFGKRIEVWKEEDGEER